MPDTIKEARCKLGLTPNEMAEAMGVHRQTLVKWERGERTPDNAALRLIQALQFMFEQGLLAEFVARCKEY